MKKIAAQYILIPVLLTAIGLGAQPPATLRAAAARVNLNFGMAIGNQINNGDTATMNLLKAHCNILVNENSMKFGSVEAARGSFNFTAPEVVVKFAEENGMKMRGHTILWGYQIGKWAEDLSSGRADVLSVIKTHIDSTMGHFKGRILEWDVVNEPIVAADTSTQLRNNVWKRNVGPDYIDSALVYAHKADPQARLFINEFWVEYPCKKAETFYNLAKGLKQRGIPLHGVGFQCHTGNSISKTELSKLIKRYGDLGLIVSLTEVDVSKSGTNPNGWRSLMDACLENPNCQSFLTWGVDDAHSWLNKNGISCDCLLFTESQQPKLNVTTLINAMNAANPVIAAARKSFGSTRIVRDARLSARKKTEMNLTPTGITYSLLEAANVRLEMFDIRGRRVAALVNSRQSMGNQTIAWNEKAFLPGLYFLKLQIDGRPEIARMAVGR